MLSERCRNGPIPRDVFQMATDASTSDAATAERGPRRIPDQSSTGKVRYGKGCAKTRSREASPEPKTASDKMTSTTIIRLASAKRVTSRRCHGILSGLAHAITIGVTSRLPMASALHHKGQIAGTEIPGKCDLAHATPMVALSTGANSAT